MAALLMTTLHGVSAKLISLMEDEGLERANKFLAAVAQPKDRKALAEKWGVDARTLLELGNRADLARIKGIGAVYSDLLEFAGVDTVVELSKRNPENLYDKIEEVAAKHHVQRLPRLEQVQDWVAQAKSLDRGIFY